MYLGIAAIQVLNNSIFGFLSPLKKRKVINVINFQFTFSPEEWCSKGVDIVSCSMCLDWRRGTTHKFWKGFSKKNKLGKQFTVECLSVINHHKIYLAQMALQGKETEMK